MKKQLIVVGMTLVLIAIGLSGCTQEDKLKNLGYKNTVYNFGLNPPAGWTIDENDPYGGIVRFYGPRVDNFTVNVGVTRPSLLNATETLQGGIQQALALYPTYFTNFTLVSENERTVNGMNSYEIIYSFVQGLYTLQGRQVLIEKNKKVFTVTYTASLISYAAYDEVVEQSIASFTIV